MEYIVRDEKGSALIVVLVAVMLIVGMASAFLLISASSSSEGTIAAEHIERLYIAEAGISAALTEIRASVDYDDDGFVFGNTAGSFAGGSYNTTAVLVGDEYTIISTGTDHANNQRAIEVIAKSAIVPLNSDSVAAVTSMAPVTLSGNISIDGRDHDINGVLIGEGVDGILCGNAVTSGGNSTIGGNNIAPFKDSVEADGVFDENFDFSTMYPGGYPDDPDDVLGVAQGTLKAAAQAAGTFFASQATYDAFIAANGGDMPGGAIVYLEFDACVPTEIGGVMNHPPSILVMHNPAGNSNMKNIHGKFKGLILADSVTHVNANSTILGAMQTTWPSSVGNTYGNGNSDILFSSEALANLPGIVTGAGGWDTVSWREVAVP